jgi:hypothetical protein
MQAEQELAGCTFAPDTSSTKKYARHHRRLPSPPCYRSLSAPCHKVQPGTVMSACAEDSSPQQALISLCQALTAVLAQSAPPAIVPHGSHVAAPLSRVVGAIAFGQSKPEQSTSTQIRHLQSAEAHAARIRAAGQSATALQQAASGSPERQSSPDAGHRVGTRPPTGPIYIHNNTHVDLRCLASLDPIAEQSGHDDVTGAHRRRAWQPPASESSDQHATKHAASSTQLTQATAGLGSLPSSTHIQSMQRSEVQHYTRQLQARQRRQEETFPPLWRLHEPGRARRQPK